MTKIIIGAIAWLLIIDYLRRRLHDYLAALDGQMEAETTEEQP